MSSASAYSSLLSSSFSLHRWVKVISPSVVALKPLFSPYLSCFLNTHIWTLTLWWSPPPSSSPVPSVTLPRSSETGEEGQAETLGSGTALGPHPGVATYRVTETLPLLVEWEKDNTHFGNPHSYLHPQVMRTSACGSLGSGHLLGMSPGPSPSCIPLGTSCFACPCLTPL